MYTYIFIYLGIFLVLVLCVTYLLNLWNGNGNGGLEIYQPLCVRTVFFTNVLCEFIKERDRVLKNVDKNKDKKNCGNEELLYLNR